MTSSYPSHTLSTTACIHMAASKALCHGCSKAQPRKACNCKKHFISSVQNGICPKRTCETLKCCGTQSVSKLAIAAWLHKWRLLKADILDIIVSLPARTIEPSSLAGRRRGFLRQDPSSWMGKKSPLRIPFGCFIFQNIYTHGMRSA